MNNYAYIDNENVNLSVQRHGRKIDWTRLRAFLRYDLQVTKAYMFLGYMPEYEKMYDLFREAGYDLVFKKVHQGEHIPNKGNIDAELVLQAMIDIHKYHQAVIVSGDGDFASLVEYLHSQKKFRAVVTPNRSRTSEFLQEAADGKFLYMDGFKNRLSYRGKFVSKKKGDTKEKKYGNAVKKKEENMESKEQKNMQKSKKVVEKKGKIAPIQKVKESLKKTKKIVKKTKKENRDDENGGAFRL